MVKKSKKSNRGIYIPILVFSLIIIGLVILTSPYYPWPKHLSTQLKLINKETNIQKHELRIYADSSGSNSLFGGCFFEIDLAECPVISQTFYANEEQKVLVPILSSVLQKSGFHRSKQGNYYRNSFYECSNNSCTMFYHKYLLNLDVSIETLPPPYKYKSRVYVSIGGAGTPIREIDLAYKSLIKDSF
jgi:hypothetical protein